MLYALQYTIERVGLPSVTLIEYGIQNEVFFESNPYILALGQEIPGFQADVRRHSKSVGFDQKK